MKWFQFIALTAFMLVFILTFTDKSSAATFTVLNTNDSGMGSLRQAILDANINNQSDTIIFDSTVFAMPQTITLTSGELTIGLDNSSGTTNMLKINGSGANKLTISGNNQSRVFLLDYAAIASINDLTITRGNGVGSIFNGAGGGICSQGQLNLSNVVVTDNTAQYYGAGIFIAAFGLKAENITVSNHRSGSGIGIYLYLGSDSTITNSTISGNNTGILNYVGVLYLTNSTIAYNGVPGGVGTGGVVSGYFMNNVATTIARNTLIARNIGDPTSPNINDLLTSQGNNLIGTVDSSLIIGDLTGNQLNVDPQLDPILRNNGGTTPTHALRVGSPAIDAGNNCVLSANSNGGCLEQPLTTDQRGFARSVDGDNNGSAIVDIGAFEVQQAEVASAPGSPDLLALSDTGISNTDNITKSRNLSFNIGGVTNGATVELMRDGIAVASTIATSGSVTLTDINAPADGVFQYTARQITGNNTSLQSAALTVTIDNTAPTVTINQNTIQADPTNIQPIGYFIVFNESVTGFDAADVSLVGSTANVSSANLQTIGETAYYGVLVSNVTSDGTVRASILANAAQDAAGNLSVASTSTDNTVTLDITPPTVTINQSSGQADPTRNTPINFTVIFSEPVAGFTNADISLAGSTANVSSASISVFGSGAVYTVSVSNITSNGQTIQVSIPALAAQDTVGNLSLASTSTDNIVTLDNVAPTVTINQTNGQPDPTAILPVNFTVVFSEPVTGFDASDLSFTGSTISTNGANINITGSGTTYNVAIGNIISNGSFIRTTVRAGTVSDLIGNLNLASTSTDNQITIDNVAPTVTINQALNQPDPALTQPLNFTVVFSELVTGFDGADISLAGSTANVSAANITVTGSGNVYTVSIGNITSNGEVRANVVASAAQDQVGTTSSASTSTDNTITIIIKRPVFDFDGDGKSDFTVFRPTDATWYLLDSSSGFAATQFGLSSDTIAPADYDGDGKTDVAVFRAGNWYWLNSSNNSFNSVQFGQAGDIPLPSDYTGDGRAELAVYRSGNWYTLDLTNNQFQAVQFGISTDKPVPADYDGDGKTDFAVYRDGNWYLLRSSQGFAAIQFGIASDKPVVGDYDGDSKADQAVYRDGNWYILGSSQGFSAVQFGIPTDIPVAADYDGDGKTDVAVFRDGNWYWLNSSNNQFRSVQFGTTNDQPIPAAFVP